MRGLTILTAVALTAASGCKKTDEVAGQVPFVDDFDRDSLGDAWTPTGGHWQVDGGAVYTTGANNAPLFLKVDLPDDVVVEVDITSETAAVDAKIELMTDGRTHQSGYIFILGGWSNKLSVIARLDEHGRDRKQKGPTGVQGNKTYHWRIEKKGGKLKWYIDGDLYMSFDDPKPLHGPGHNRLAFSNWQNQLRYDNLKIWPYDQAPPSTAKAKKPSTATAAGQPTTQPAGRRTSQNNVSTAQPAQPTRPAQLGRPARKAQPGATPSSGASPQQAAPRPSGK